MEDDPDNDSSHQPWDSGTSDDTVTITAPVRTVNWSLLAMAALFAFWVYNQLDTRDAPWNDDGEEDDREDG